MHSAHFIFMLALSLGFYGQARSHTHMDLPSFSYAFELMTEKLVPCGTTCVVYNYRKLIKATNECVLSQTGFVQDVERFISENNLGAADVSYAKIYDVFFREGKSPLCAWYKQWIGCFETQYGQICGPVVKDTMMRLFKNFENLICSQNPNYLACTLHPTLMRIDRMGTGPNAPSQPSGPYHECIQHIAFLENVNPENYYQDLLISENGQKLFRPLKGFAKCIGLALEEVPAGEATGCTTAGPAMYKSMAEDMDYFDYGKTGKDYLKCFANPALHQSLVQCGQTFVQDLGNVYPAQDPWIGMNRTLYSGNPAILKTPYSGLSVCIRQAMASVCASQPESRDLAERMLSPLDNYYDVTPRNEELNVCIGSFTSGTLVWRMSLVTFLLSLVCGLMWGA